MKHVFSFLLAFSLSIAPLQGKSSPHKESWIDNPVFGLVAAAGSALLGYVAYKGIKKWSLKTDISWVKQIGDTVQDLESRYQKFFTILSITPHNIEYNDSDLERFFVEYMRLNKSYYSHRDLQTVQAYKADLKHYLTTWSHDESRADLVKKAKKLYPHVKNLYKKMVHLDTVVMQHVEYLNLGRTLERYNTTLFKQLQYYYQLYSRTQISKKEYRKEVIKAVRQEFCNKYPLHEALSCLKDIIHTLKISKNIKAAKHPIHHYIQQQTGYMLEVLQKAHNLLDQSDAYKQEKLEYELEKKQNQLLQLEREKAWLERERLMQRPTRPTLILPKVVTDTPDTHIVLVETKPAPTVQPPVIINNNPTITVTTGNNNVVHTEAYEQSISSNASVDQSNEEEKVIYSTDIYQNYLLDQF